MAIAIIPARGGSRRIPRKNIKQFFGKPIIAYSIKTAVDSGLFEKIVVSTDDDEIAALAKRFGAGTQMRSARMSRNEVGTQEVARYVLEHASLSQEDTACVIYPTAPLMTIGDLRRARNAYLGSPIYAMAVGTDPLRDAGIFYWGASDAFLVELPLVAEHTAMIPIPETRVCDINTPAEWNAALDKYAALHGLTVDPKERMAT